MDGESPNDRNDRAIRVASAWYTKRIPGVEIIMLTNDADNRRKALAEGVKAMSVQVCYPHRVSPDIDIKRLLVSPPPTSSHNLNSLS